MTDVKAIRKFFGEGKNFKHLTVQDLITYLQGIPADTVLCKYLDEGGPICYPLSALPLTFQATGEDVHLDNHEEERPAPFPLLIFDSIS
jgi:hypothetical protein